MFCFLFLGVRDIDYGGVGVVCFVVVVWVFLFCVFWFL